jgi:hypothetical protein
MFTSVASYALHTPLLVVCNTDDDDDDDDEDVKVFGGGC